MDTTLPLKRTTHTETGLHIYGVERKDVEEIKVSFVVARKHWGFFKNDLENFGAFKNIDYFSVTGEAIKLFGPIRGCIVSRGTNSQNDQLLTYLSDHPAFNVVAEPAPAIRLAAQA